MPLFVQTRPDGIDQEPHASLIGDVLFPLPAHRRSALGIIAWWESRRLTYNVIVGSTGLVSLAFIGLISIIPPGMRFGPPLIGVVAYGVAANVCYTFGSLIEITLQRLWGNRVHPVGPALFRQGVAFSVGLTLLPIFVASVSWVVRLGMLIFGKSP